jgi:hypothetical protein
MICGFALRARAQSAGDMPLGDLARSYRRNQPPPPTVIDNDNLSDVMEKGETRNWTQSLLHLSLNPSSVQLVNASSPDVTCALTYTAGPRQSAPPDNTQSLPDTELVKLEGPAAILDNALQISVFNGSAWDVHELTVSLTVVRRPGATDIAQSGTARLVTTSLENIAPSEKFSDSTVLYHIKGNALPSGTTQFRAPLNATPGPDQEWHWAIVQAKGVPPAPPLTEPEPSVTVVTPSPETKSAN